MTDKNTEKKPRRVGDGTPGPGRPKGLENKTTKLLKEALIIAAEAVGSDGDGKDGLSGYCEDLARNEKKAFAALMGRLLPLQIQGPGEDGKITVNINK